RIALTRDMSEFDPVHLSGKIDVGHQERQRVAVFVQETLGRLGAFALEDVVIALLEQQGDHLSLHGIVFNNQRGRSIGLRLSHWSVSRLRPPKLTYVKSKT